MHRPTAVRRSKAKRAPAKKGRPAAGGINRKLLGLGVVALLIAAVIVYAAIQATAPAGQGSASEGSGAGQLGRAVPIQGTQHVQPGEPHPAYNSTPPTSGWHYANPARWGIHDEPILDEAQVHNLEHGGIVVQYNCPDECPELVDKLKKVVTQYQTKVMLAPYPKMPSRIALTAWGRIDTMDDVDEGQIKRFIAAFVDRGPEKVP